MVSTAAEAGRKIMLPYQRRWLDDRSPLKIWLAARQTGKSFSLALEAVVEGLESRRSTNLILSASQRQSREVMEKVLSHLRLLRAISNEALGSEATREEVRLPNGSRIISLPANPDTVRGFSGNVFLDEFAFHQSTEDIWRAMYPAITRGFKVRVSSTPNGKANLFHTLWTDGSRPFSRHKTTIEDAQEEGLPIDLIRLREGMSDPHAWAQEFECAFLDESATFIPYGLIAACEHEEATKELTPFTVITPPTPPLSKGGRDSGGVAGELYLGADIGRKNDLTVFWLWQKTGDVYWTRMVREMRDTPFSLQRDFLYGLLDGSLIGKGGGGAIRRAAIDSTGIGAQLAEEAKERFAHLVEPVVFTSRVKEELALGTRRLLEEQRLRIPASREIREDFHSLRRYITSAGNTRFDAGHSEATGHADRFWAAALGIHAGTKTPPFHFEYESAGRRAFAGINL